MPKDEDKIFVECECVDRHSVLSLEYLEDYDEFALVFYRRYFFKKRKEVDSLIIGKKQAQQIIDFLQKERE